MDQIISDKEIEGIDKNCGDPASQNDYHSDKKRVENAFESSTRWVVLEENVYGGVDDDD